MIRVQNRSIPLILLTLGEPLALGGSLNPAASDTRLPVPTMSQAKQRLTEINGEQRKLAPLSMRGGIGATGYRSQSYADADHTVWIQLNLDDEVAIDQIVLVPTIWQHTRSGYRADGFPNEFHILVGGDKAPEGIVIARYGAEDLLLPRVAPVVINCPPATKGYWRRVVATSLSPRLWDGRLDLQLSEIMVFQDDDNVALRAGVDVSSDAYATVASLDKRFLVDGHVPYGTGTLIGFAEIEAFSGDRNVALKQPIDASFETPPNKRQLAVLTDGRNFYGDVLPVRAWMNQLARRHELQRERPRVQADLHDELGANLHTIGLLSDLADHARQTPGELATYLQRIRAWTERTGIAMQHLVDVHDAHESLKGFLPDMRHAVERIVVDLDHKISVEGEQYIERLKPRTRVDLLLFYKECLVNISRHSGATRLRTHPA